MAWAMAFITSSISSIRRPFLSVAALWNAQGFLTLLRQHLTWFGIAGYLDTVTVTVTMPA